jgi:ABC-type uncharacterized transport system involved in gliding motility auxiliary subunit
MKSWLKKILILLNIILYFVSVLLWISAPDNLILNLSTSSFTLIYSVIIFILIGDSIKRFLLSRFSKRFFSEFVGIILVCGIWGIINYLGYKNSFQWDVSSDRINSLSEQSKLIVNQIKPGSSAILYAKRENWDQVLPILRLYQKENKNLVLNAIDIELAPHKARELGVQQFPVILIKQGNASTIVEAMDELAITNGFLKLSQNKTIRIYYTTGHGELEVEDTSNEGASVLMTMIKNSNMELLPLSLMKIDKIPEDASAILSLGPQDGFLKNELSLLNDYLSKGGRYLLTVSPDFKGDRLNGLRELLTHFGIRFNNDIVLDRLSSVHNVDASIPIVEKYNSQHPIMKNFKATTIFPMTSSIESLENDDFSFEALVQTSPFPASWAEKNLKQVQDGKVTFDPQDKKGPIVLAGIVFEKAKNDLETKIGIIGSTSLIVNGYANQSPNFNLFLNILSWLVGNEGLISLNRPVLNHERIMMSSPQIGTIFYFSVIFLPMGLFSFAFYLYRRRLKS